VKQEKNGRKHATSGNSIYRKLHVWITFQARFKNKHAVSPSHKYMSRSHVKVKQFWSMFGSYFKHISRTNMLFHPVSNTCRNNMLNNSGSHFKHISRTNMLCHPNMLQKFFEYVSDVLHKRIWVGVAFLEVVCSPPIFPRWTSKRRFSRLT
jgi:hypothetical protein